MNSAIIVAAGKGTRMGPNIDKLFLEVAGRPLVAYTWLNLDAATAIDEVILVVRDGLQEAFQILAAQLPLTKPFRLVGGGLERQDSVWNGLQAIPQADGIAVIQDGARPCTSNSLIHHCIEAARQTGASVAAQRVTDTIKESSDGKHIQRTLDRSRLWSVQTPQTFRVEIIRQALRTVRDKGLRVTDDTAACELIGQPVALVESFDPNPKLTTTADLPFLQHLLAQQWSNRLAKAPNLS